MADGSVLVDGPLCYVQNYFGSVPNNNIGCVLNGFCTSDEVATSKTLLFSLVDKLVPSDSDGDAPGR